MQGQETNQRPEKESLPLSLAIVEQDWEGIPSWTQPCHQSSIATCLNCKRKFLFRNRWCIHPKSYGPQGAKGLGTMTHRLFQLGKEKTQVFIDEVESSMAALIAQIDAGEDLLGAIAQRVSEIEEQKNKALMMFTLIQEIYPDPPNQEVLATEHTFVQPYWLENFTASQGPLWIEGTLDRVVRNTDTEGIFIRDYKTSSRDVEFTLTGYQYSLQNRLYRLGTFLELGVNPVGFILDIMQTPAIKLCDTDKKNAHAWHCTPPEAYLRRAKEWYATKGQASVHSFSVHYTEPLFPDELLGALNTACHFMYADPDPREFPRDVTTSACTQWERVCEYYPLCHADQASWSALIEHNYTVTPPTLPEGLTEKGEK